MIAHLLLALTAAAPCIRLTRAATQVQGDVRVCPGRYRVADPTERGVLIAASSGTRIDLTGVILESGDSLPDRFVGIGVASKGVDGVTVVGGTVRGYRFGVRIEGGRNHRLSGIDVSNSRRQILRSTPDRADSTDRLDVTRLEAADQYGAGLMLRNTTGATVTGIVSHGAQNGISLVDASMSYVADNDLADNSGWAIQLYRSSHNSILRNDASRTRRCPAAGSDCASAAILLREASDSNTLVENDLTASTIGVLVTGQPPVSRPSVGNLVYRNDASLATVVAFAARMTWNVSFIENRADSAAAGFELMRLTGGLLRGNTVIGARRGGILATRGDDTGLEANVLLGGPVGIQVTTGDGAGRNGRGYRIDDNMLNGVDQGVVLRGVTDSRVRGNVFDGVGTGLVVDGTGHGTEVSGNVFLRASSWFIDAPDLMAGGNYWATADAAAAAARVRGRISVLPWKPASAAGY
ncbi:MAG TPA: right-handed parallel beta-helix repeat-containing protein [Gemmatimonadales bacterium]|nr:right-handed parallel beta-helix repeat-containing protein [Gemmatimonadales bacterium]